MTCVRSVTNSLIRQQRNGNEACHIATVLLNDACMDTSAIRVDGYIPHEYFFNIIYQKTEIAISLNLFGLDEMINFIETHAPSVHENKCASSEILAKKYTYLRYGEIETAYQIGVGATYSIVDELLFGCFELACLFSLESDKKEFSERCKEYEKLLKKGKSDNNQVHSNGYYAFVEKLRELRRLDDSMQNLHQLDKPSTIPLYQSLQNELQNSSTYVSMKSWLLDMLRKRIQKWDTLK